MTGDLFAFRLSFPQQRLWFLEQLAPGMVAYNLAGAIRLTGPLDVASLEKALKTIIARHESLRTTFRYAGDSPEQVVRSEVAFRLPVVELADLAPEKREEEALRLASIEGGRSFDLAAGPLFRSVLYRLNAEHHILMLSTHHIVTDGWSNGVFMRELETLYGAFREGREASLADLPIQYPDYAEWQRDYLQGETLERLLGYWRDRLQGAPAVIDLPTDRPRPAVESHRGATVRFDLPRPLATALSELARREGATLFMTLLAGFKILLARYSGQYDVVVGSPIAGRDRSELEGLIGLFVNTLVLRTDMTGAKGFRDVLARVRETCLGAYGHQDMPFERLVEELRPERELSHNPLFQVAFALQNTPSRSLSLRGMTVTPLELERASAQFSLALHMLETGSGLSGLFEYSTDLFDAGTVERMAGHFGTLLAAAVADPDRPVSELRMLTPEEERTILVEWNRTAGDYATDTTLAALVEAQADRTPDAAAIVSEAARITYGELEARANRIAHRIRSLGAGPGALVAVCVDRSIDMVAAQLGVLKAGAAFVPVETSYPRDRIAYMLDDARVAVILAGRRIAADLPDVGAPVVLLDADPSLDGESAARPAPTAGPESLAYVIYTSGSTGKPKGAMIHHRAIVNHVLWMRSRWPLGPGDAMLQNASASFDASVWEIWNTLAGGARLVIGRPGAYGDSASLVAAMIENQVTHALIVPSMLEFVAREPGFERCGSLRHLFAGGEALTRALVERVRERVDAEVVNLYGPTETTINATSWVTETGAGPFAHTVPIGRPITNHRTYVLDAGLRPVPVGMPGELHIGGAGVGAGYLRRPELTAEKFLPDPFAPGGRLYKTGDVCRFREDGVIEFLGRNDHQVKVRGFRIELGEIEAALLDYADVAQAVVASREEVRGDVRLVAYLVPRPGGSPDVAELRVFLRGRLPEYMVPSAFVVLASLPLTPAGKVDRKALPTPDSVRPTLQTRYEAPRTEIETAIAAIWKELLRVDQVGIHDNFFDLGGHSLLLIQVQARMEQLLKRKLPVVELFQFPNIEALARHLSSEGDAASSRDRIRDRADRQRQAMSRQRERREKGGKRP